MVSVVCEGGFPVRVHTVIHQEGADGRVALALTSDGCSLFLKDEAPASVTIWCRLEHFCSLKHVSHAPFSTGASENV